VFPEYPVTSVTSGGGPTRWPSRSDRTLVAMSSERQGLGILGGTFDPPHIGHLAAAVEVRSALDLDEVLLVVANEPWQKVGRRPLSAAGDRLAMTQRAVLGFNRIGASDLEIRRGGTTYTIDTLEQLRADAPDRPLFLVVGADAAAELHTWHRHEELPALATLVIVERNGERYQVPTGEWRLERVAMPRLDISSSELRDRARLQGDLAPYVPFGVIDEIRNRGLYGLAES